jgi:hypothetical protein
MEPHFKHLTAKVQSWLMLGLCPCAAGVRFVTLVACGWWGLTATLSGQEFGSGVLLLKETERVLSGKITLKGEFYEVEIAPNSRVSIPLKNVAHLGGSMEELYQAKRGTISHWSIGDHFQLTRWCLVNDLLPRAAEHYAKIVAQTPDHPRVKQLGIELQERLLRDEKFREYLGMNSALPAAMPPASSPHSPQVATSQTAVPPGPASGVVQASTAQFAANQLPANQIPVTQHPEIARQFTERVQPILLNRCSQAACHGSQSSTHFRLTPPYGSTAARLSAENLATVLRLISQNPSEASHLTHYATQPHGIQPAPAIALNETKLIQELENWIALVRNPVVLAVGSSTNGPGPQVRTAGQFNFEPFAAAVTLIPVDPGRTPLRPVPQQQAAGPAASVKPGGTPVGSGFPLGTQPPSLAEIDALDVQLKATLGEFPPPSPVPAPTVDPFDPAEFNRRLK